MARDDYGAISVISDEEKEILGIGGPKKPEEEEEKLFETIGKAADKIGETQVGKKIGTIITVVLLALLSGGANMSIIHDFMNGDERMNSDLGLRESWIKLYYKNQADKKDLIIEGLKLQTKKPFKEDNKDKACETLYDFSLFYDFTRFKSEFTVFSSEIMRFLTFQHYFHHNLPKILLK